DIAMRGPASTWLACLRTRSARIGTWFRDPTDDAAGATLRALACPRVEGGGAIPWWRFCRREAPLSFSQALVSWTLASMTSRPGSYAGGESASRGYDRGSREMFSATCASCGREAQVPFRPSGARPVYCSDCFTAQRRSY